jgi:hypothetical protein
MACGQAQRGSARPGPCGAWALAASSWGQGAVRSFARRCGSRAPAPIAVRRAIADVHPSGVGVAALERGGEQGGGRAQRRGGDEGQGPRLWAVSSSSPDRGARREEHRGGRSDGGTGRLPHGSRTVPVTSAGGADSRDQPHRRAHSTNAGTVTTTHGLPATSAENARAGLFLGHVRWRSRRNP